MQKLTTFQLSLWINQGILELCAALHKIGISSVNSYLMTGARCSHDQLFLDRLLVFNLTGDKAAKQLVS